MANFTTESAVRLKFQVEDTVHVSSALIAGSIDGAHGEILGLLDAGVDTEQPGENLVLGETLLAGAHLLASLASRNSASRAPVTVGGQRIDGGKHFAPLMALASRAEREAWRTLAPYLSARPGAAPGGATDTLPVLGGG